MLNSKYLDWLSEYDTNITAAGGSAGTNQQIGRGAFAGRFLITPSRRNSGSTVDDSQVQSELAAQIASGNLPTPSTDVFGNSNTYYAIFFPHGVRLTLAGSSSCVSGGFCAYHGTIANVNGNEVYYGVHPDMQAGSGCDTGCGAGTTFENQTSTASHEMIETITDPEVALARNLAPPLAWYDQSNGEIGDICNQQQATIVGADAITYTVQKEWSNSAGACILEMALPIVWKNVPYQGNPGDNAANCFGGNCGSVQYRYDISEYQVTNTQYAEFLNAKAASDPLGLYNPSMGSDPNNGGIPQNGVSGGFTYSVSPASRTCP